MYSANMFAADMKSTYMLGVGSSEFLPNHFVPCTDRMRDLKKKTFRNNRTRLNVARK